MKRRIIIIVILAVLLLAAALLMYIPKKIECSMTAATAAGETAKVDVNIRLYSSILLPSFAKGTITVDGVEYTDKYTKLNEFSHVSDNRLFPADWWKNQTSVPYNLTFLKSDGKEFNAVILNYINIFDVEFDDGISKIHYMYSDVKNQVGSNITGVSHFGPAENARQAEEIAAYFGYDVK